MYTERDVGMVLGVGPTWIPPHFMMEGELPTQHFPHNPTFLCHLLFYLLTASKELMKINDCFHYLSMTDIKVAFRRI